MSDTLAGRSVLVTGGSRGIGFAVCRRLLAAGAWVRAVARTPADLAAASAVIDSDRFATSTVDVTDADAVETVVGEVVGEHGGLDVLVACHGVYEPGVPVHETVPGDFDRTVAVNLRGVFICARAAARAMLATTRSGRIILFGSINGAAAEPGAIAYNVTKAAVPSIGQTLAVELAAHGVTVNTVAPGWVRTGMAEPYLTAADAAALNPLGRLGEPEEIAEVVAWLAGPAPTFLTGAQLIVDGAQTAALTSASNGASQPIPPDPTPQPDIDS